MLTQMPSQVQVELFSNFLFKIFLERFKYFFTFKRDEINPWTGKILKHAYYNWTNEDY